jgi:hypothetical protein
MNEYQNRIVGHGEKPASEFRAHGKNWRKHPKNQREALHGVLAEVGWVQDVIVNQRTGVMIDGHARVELALKQGSETMVPFIEVDLSESEEALILASLDPISAMATADSEKLDALLRDVSTGDAALQAMLADLADEYGSIGDYTTEKIRERTEYLEHPRDMLRVLISIPVDMAIDAREYLEALSKIEGTEIDYGTNNKN